MAEVTPSDLLKILDAVSTAIDRGDAPGASAQLDTFIRLWPNIESAVAARSQDAYTAIEVDLGRVGAALKTQPAELERAEAAIEHMREALAPFAVDHVYTSLDAATIILREGFEALLVIVALLASLRRSGNHNKRGWIWVGSVLGVLASIITAVILQAGFSRVSDGQNREAIEGITGLAAAVLLFYVSYWLHSKASLQAWRGYIDTRTRHVLARGNIVGLVLLSFLIVLREGAETTVFYLGMAPAIAFRDLLLGLSIGIVALASVAVLTLVAGMRLSLRLFFRGAGLLIYYLGLKFVGTGIHALQVASMVSVSPVASLPAIPVFGVYPTWETALPQLVLVLVALVAMLYLYSQERRALATATTTRT